MSTNDLGTILVIDDLPENLVLLSELLTHEGYEVKVARSGKLALRTLDYFHPDLILLDIAMPDMDGYEVCTHLKNNSLTADIPVIFLTALDQTTDQVKAFSVGGNDYIVKPIREEEVIARINTQLKIVQQQRKLKQEIEERKTAEAIAQEALAVKSRFLANISHEIRTPLSAMVSVIELLGLTSLDTRQKDLVKILQSSSDYLLSLMNDILDFSKLESAKIELEAVDFSLDQLIEEVIDLFAIPASVKGIELYYFKSVDVPSYLLADQLRLRQVLTNLMSNALKFTHQGEIIIDVQLQQVIKEAITDNTQSDYLKISIQDTGIGMSQETLTKIFQPFTQADLSVSRVYGGTGLGLNICQQLIKLMGGEIGLESTIGQGTKFWFTIPLEIPLANQLNQVDRLNIANNIPSIEKPIQQILIVDPAPTRRKLLTEYAHSRGLEVISVNPKEFYNYCEQDQPPILEDVIMIMINQEVFDQAPVQMNWPTTLHNLPIVIITNNQSYKLPIAIAPQRIFAYLTRPVKLSAFHKCIDAWQAGEINLIEKPLASIYHQQQVCQEKILVVEDTIINQKVILNLLAQLGYQADCVSHGKDALEQIEKNSYDLVFMDCQMPILDGFTTVEIIRQLEQFTVRQQPTLIIIGLTAATGKETRAKCLEVGMNDYLTKPITLDKLTQVLNKWLNKNIDEHSDHLDLILLSDVAENHSNLSDNSGEHGAKLDNLLIDWGKLEIITRGNQQLARELIQDFITDTRITLTNLQRAIADQDSQAGKALAHTIKGNAGTLGVKYMWEISASIEHQIEHQYWAKCSQLATELDHVLQCLETYTPEYVLPKSSR